LRIDALSGDQVVLRDIHSDETKQTSLFELVEALDRGHVRHPDTKSIEVQENSDLSRTEIGKVNARQESQNAVQQMLAKRAWIQALHAKGIDIITDDTWVRVAIEQLEQGELTGTRKFSISTLASTARELQNVQGDWSQLVPRFSGRGGAGKSRIDPRAQAVIDGVLAKSKGENGPIVFEEMFASVRNAIQSLNLASPENPITVPGDTTTSRRAHLCFTAKEIHVRNHGAESAARRYRQNSYPRDKSEFPLLISEYDDLDTGVFLVDDSNCLPFGRGYLTHGICQNTLVPLGFDLSHHARSFDSAMGAITDSFLPKDTARPEFEGAKHPWIGFGVQGSILLDNAKYNLSESMALGASEATLALCGVRPYGPTEKSSIEHFNRTTKDEFCSKLPGWRGDKSDPDAVKNGMRTAALSVEAFRKFYVHWVVGDYLNKAGVDGWTPKQRWSSHFLHHGPAIRWTREQIAFMRLRPMLQKFSESGGLPRLSLSYNSDELIRWCDELGKNAQVLMFTDRNDLTYILARHPRTKVLIRVLCTTDYKYTKGLTEHQQQLILKMARLRGKKNPTLRDMVEARDELRKLVQKEAASSKLRRRQFAQRAGKLPNHEEIEKQIDGDRTPSGKTQIVDRVVTDLEYSIIQLEAIETDEENGDWGNQ
jgi:hypothetical protein